MPPTMDKVSSERLSSAFPGEAGAWLSKLGGPKIKQLHDDTLYLTNEDFKLALQTAAGRSPDPPSAGPQQLAYTPSEPDGQAMTTPQDLPQHLDTPTGLAQLEVLLQNGKLYLSPQACFEIQARFPRLRDKVVPSGSLLAHTLAALLFSFEPTVHEESTEDMKGQLIYKLTGDVIYLLSRHAKDNGPNRMRQNRNAAFSTAETTNTLTSKREAERPDYMLVCDGLILLLGEEKRLHKDLVGAWDDVENKLRGGYPQWSYLGISYILCFAAAHDVLQFGIVRVKDGQVTKLERRYNLASLTQRLEVMLAVTNIFSFIQPLLKLAPKDTRQRFDPSKVISHGSSVIKFAKPAGSMEYVVRKSIPHVQRVWSDPSRQLGVVQAAYDATASSPFCRQAHSGPVLNTKRKRSVPVKYEQALSASAYDPIGDLSGDEEDLEFVVDLKPVCYQSDDMARLTPDQMKAVVRAGLEGCRALHCYTTKPVAGSKTATVAGSKTATASAPTPKPIVHTDLRLPNFLWDGPQTCLLSDFESCRDAGCEVAPSYRQAGWDEGTCEVTKEGRLLYTTESDLYQLGKMLESWMVMQREVPPVCAEMANLLKSKKSSAEQLLAHAYITGRG